MLDTQAISYLGSKAVKVTESMRKDLNTYDERATEIEKYQAEIKNSQKTRDDKNSEITSLQTDVNNEDKKVARDASKKIKAIEKEIKEIETSIKNNENKLNKLQEKNNKAKLTGIMMKPFSSLMNEAINDDFAAELNHEFPNMDADNDLTAELDDNFPGEVNPESIPAANKEEAPAVYNEEAELTPISEASPENDTTLADEMDNEPLLSEEDANEIWEGLKNVEFNEEKPAIEPDYTETPIVPVYDDEQVATPTSTNTDIEDKETNNEDAEISNEEMNSTEIQDSPMAPFSIAQPVMETPEITQAKKEVATEIPAEMVDENSKVNNSEDQSDDNIAPAEITEEASQIPEMEEDNKNIENSENLQQAIHQDIENSIPPVEVIEPVNTENVMNEVYDEVGLVPEIPEKTKERDLKNLTLFKDYEDYTFAFGQKHYGQEALTPNQLEKLTEVSDFLSEKAFLTKRTTQYTKIADENKRLKKKVVTLGKEFTKKVDGLSATYNDNVEALTNMTEAAKEQAEADRVEKIQTQKLNDELTKTIKEQTATIDTLTSTKEELESTIQNQKANIEDLEKQNADQAAKIQNLEDKLNTVFGIVKEVKN